MTHRPVLFKSQFLKQNQPSAPPRIHLQGIAACRRISLVAANPTPVQHNWSQTSVTTKTFSICPERGFGFSAILGSPDSGMIRCSSAWYFMLGFFWPKNIHKQFVLREPELQQKGPFFATSIPVYLTSVRFLLTKCRRRLTPMCRLTLSRKHHSSPGTYTIYV